MEKVNKIISLFSKFQIENIGDDWVTIITDSDYTEIEDIPIEFLECHASTNFLALLKETTISLRDWIDNDSISDVNDSTLEVRKLSLTALSTSSIYEEEVAARNIYSKFWIELTSTYSAKALLSFLFYHSYRAQHYDANEEKRELGVLSSSVYFLLLCVPGSNAFGLFHPFLYLKCLDIMKLTTKLNIGAASPRKKGAKIIRRPSEDMIGNDDDEEEMSYLSSQETSKLIRSLNILLNDFLRLLKKFSLKHSNESLEETLSILVEITKCELHNANGIFINRHAANTVSALAYNAYVALQEMCSPLHGNVAKIIKMIMKFVMPNILMTSRGTSDLSLRALGIIREHSVIFVKYLYAQMKEEAHNGVFILLQHLCLNVTDKADYRERTARSVVDILHIFPITFYTSFIEWLYRFSHNEKAGHRLFTLEIISKLLDQDERTNDMQEENDINIHVSSSTKLNSGSLEEVNSFGNVPSDNSAVNQALKQNVLSHKFLLGIIFSRCRDSAATVRAKALSLLAGCTLSSNSTIAESMKEIFFGPAEIFQTPHIHANINCESPMDAKNTTENLKLPNADMIFSLLKRRAIDDRVTVRKSALQVIENLIKMDKSFATSENLKILVLHCRDFALFIRKQMIISLTSVLVVYPSSDLIIQMWVSGVMPLILDPEMKVQEKVLEVVDSILFCSIEKHTEGDKDPKACLPWRVLDAVTSLSLHKFLSKVLMLWSKSEFQKPNIIAKVKTHIGTSTNEQAWTLLSILSQYIVFREPIFALEYFEEHSNDISQVSSYTLQQVLKVLQHSIKHLPQDRALNLRTQLLGYIDGFQLEVELISVVIDCITLITYSIHGAEAEGQNEVENWAAPILKCCEQYLKDILFPLEEVLLGKDEEELFFRHLYTLGETALLCPCKVNKRMFLMLQSLIFHETRSKDDPVRMPSSQTQSSQPPAVSFKPTTRLKALAVVTVGKICLQHEDQAKRIIPALGKMLEVTVISSIKINTIFVLSDMCVRYATLVDPLIPQITGCLKDPDVQVRKTTLTLLISLLQEDFLKLKGSFFYRILQCLCDDHDDIKSTVAFFMTERLLKRFPNVFQQHFIECIFHYNCYEEHESYNRFVQTEQEKKLFSLAGQEHRLERMKLYCFMLEHMSDDQRFATTQKLCQDVLGGIVVGRIKLTPSSQSVLQDTLVVLSSEEIKLAFLKSTPEDTDQPTDRAEKQALTGIIVKRTIVSQVVKQNVIENIIPILISLKNRLEEQRSPMMKQLLLYIKDIMKDYKNEVKEILAGDKQLAKEIEFDLRRIEREQQQKDEELRNKCTLEKSRTENSLLSTEENDNSLVNGGTLSKSMLTVSKLSPCLNLNQVRPNVPHKRIAVNLLKTVLLASQRRQSVYLASGAAAPPDITIHRKRSRSLEQVLFIDGPQKDAAAEHDTEDNAGNDDSIDENNDERNCTNEIINEKSLSPDYSRRKNINDKESLTEQNTDEERYEMKNIEDNIRNDTSRCDIPDDTAKETLNDDTSRCDIPDDTAKETVNDDISRFDIRDETTKETVYEDINEENDDPTFSKGKIDEPNFIEDINEENKSINQNNEEICIKNNIDNEQRDIGEKEQRNDTTSKNDNDDDQQEHDDLEENTTNSGKITSKSKLNVKRKNIKITENIDKSFSTTVMDKKREKFLRAISTPQMDKSILQNITFINKSQDVSAIGFNSMNLSSSSEGNSHSFIKLKDHEVFAQDEQFSRLRRSPRWTVEKERQQDNPAKKRSSGEALYESYNSRFNPETSILNESSESNSSYVFRKPLTPASPTESVGKATRKSCRNVSNVKEKSPVKRKRPRHK